MSIEVARILAEADGLSVEDREALVSGLLAGYRTSGRMAMKVSQSMRTNSSPSWTAGSKSV